MTAKAGRSERRRTRTADAGFRKELRFRRCSVNLYMRRFVLGWKQRGLESRLQAKIVSYADDYVICCKGDVDEALAEMRLDDGAAEADGQRGEDTRASLAARTIRFSGLQLRAVLLAADGPSLLGTRPSKKSLRRVIGAIRESTDRRTTWLEAERWCQTINRKLLGWANYFSLGPVSKAYRAIDQYTTSTATSVVMQETQGAQYGRDPVLGRVPARARWDSLVCTA